MGKIFEKILPSKNIDRWQIITWKKARHHYSSERHKLKQDMTIYHLNSKMFFKKKSTIPNVGENAEQLEYSHITCGNEKWYIHFRNSWSIFCTVKNILLYHSDHISRYLSKKNENCGHIKTCMQELIVIYSQSLKTENNPNEWKDKL